MLLALASEALFVGLLFVLCFVGGFGDFWLCVLGYLLWIFNYADSVETWCLICGCL